jgi:hypothetical protein
MRPFMAYPPPRLLSYIPGTTRVEAVDEMLRNREQILTLLRENIKHAQQRMKRYADLGLAIFDTTREPDTGK